ncbi:MAG: hypothetical protein LBJ00_16395 [Planctomycetaceae bacterium]|nr:hypothetical protein [Planctomycetaceae bacterium]
MQSRFGSDQNLAQTMSLKFATDWDWDSGWNWNLGRMVLMGLTWCSGGCYTVTGFVRKFFYTEAGIHILCLSFVDA